jgi:hypothetical protein
MKTCVVIPTVCRTFFVFDMVMALRAGGRTPDEIVVIDQTTRRTGIVLRSRGLNGSD